MYVCVKISQEWAHYDIYYVQWLWSWWDVLYVTLDLMYMCEGKYLEIELTKTFTTFNDYGAD